MSQPEHPEIIPIPKEYYTDKKPNEVYIKNIRAIFKKEAMKSPNESFKILPPPKDEDD